MPSPAPNVDERSASSPACDAHRQRLRVEVCGADDDPDDTGGADVTEEDEECDAAQFVCSQSLDLDGDGKTDCVEFAGSAERPTLAVSFGDGRHDTIGATPTAVTEYREPGDVGRTQEPGFEWIVAWKPAVRVGDTLQLHTTMVDAGLALGDGLWMSGGDAAALLVLTADGWLLIELGY